MANTIDNEWETISQDEWEPIPLQGSAPKNINPALDATQGLISGLTEMPRAIDKVISPIANPVANAISYPFANKNESFEDYSKRNDEAYNKTLEDYKPQTALGGAAKFVGSALPTLAIAPTKIGGSALLGAGLGAVNSINRGDDPFEVALNTVGGGIGGGLGHGALKKVEELAQPVGKFIANKAAGISPESYQNVLNKYKQGENPFKGKFNLEEAYNTLGKKATNAVNIIKKETGESVGSEVEAIRNPENKKLFNLNDINDTIKEELGNKNYGGIQSLDKADLDAINSIQELLKKHEHTLDGEQLYGLKKLIQNKYQTFDPNTVKTTTTEGDYIISKIAKQIDDKLSKAYPEYKQAAVEYSNIKKAQKQLGGKLKDVNIGNALRNMNTQENKIAGYPELFKQVDEMANPENKFMQELQDLQARSQFERVLPNSNGEPAWLGGGHSPLGIYSGYSLLHGNPSPLALHALLAGIRSPSTYKAALQGGQFASKNINPYVPSQAVNLYQQYLDSIKGQENER